MCADAIHSPFPSPDGFQFAAPAGLSDAADLTPAKAPVRGCGRAARATAPPAAAPGSRETAGNSGQIAPADVPGSRRVTGEEKHPTAPIARGCPSRSRSDGRPRLPSPPF
jgi:hypothetical protein